MAQELKRQEQPALRRWFDDTPLAMLRQEMDDLFESFFSGRSLPALTRELAPSVDVAETEDALEIKTDLPGFKPGEVNIEMGEGSITISGEHSEESKEEGPDKKYHRVERRHGSFLRTVWLPCAVDEENIEAELKDGILSVRLPKSPEAKQRKITVKG
jgi:HSP20 family protein